MKRLFFLIWLLLGVGLGLLLAQTELGAQSAQLVQQSATQVKKAALEKVVAAADLDTRALVILENPEVLEAIQAGGSFGGDKHSNEAAQNMFGRVPAAIEDIKAKTEIIEVADRSWLIRMPIVNAVLFETDEGLVLVDTGMAPAGPAIVEAIKSVSDQPLVAVIYTHGHVDHSYGTWALLEAGWDPEIIAQENLVTRFERYIRLRGSLANYMSQPEEQLPSVHDDLVWPTKTFKDELVLTIGGEDFVLKHHRGETDDQLYVWVPGRRALASADYYQGFLPNAGNGKRSQRYVEDWAQAMREMAALQPEYLLPAHGAPIAGQQTIVENFLVLADALQYIVDYTITELNKGVRKDLIVSNMEWPSHFANEPTLNIQYVTPQDISKMIIKQYTGWWNDIPSQWTPAALVEQAAAIANLAGGADQLAIRAEALAATNIRLASHFVDWAFYADPENPVVQDAVISVYKQRILDGESNTMEMLAYLDQMARARELQR